MQVAEDGLTSHQTHLVLITKLSCALTSHEESHTRCLYNKYVATEASMNSPRHFIQGMST